MKKTGARPVLIFSSAPKARQRLFGERANLFGQPALMTRGLIAMDDALVHHAVDHRSRGGEGGGRLVLLAGLERQGCLADRAAQLRGKGVVTGSMHRRLAGSLFSRFRIRQAQTPCKISSPNRTRKEPRSLPIGPALVNRYTGRRPGTCYSGATELRET